VEIELRRVVSSVNVEKSLLCFEIGKQVSVGHCPAVEHVDIAFAYRFSGGRAGVHKATLDNLLFFFRKNKKNNGKYHVTLTARRSCRFRESTTDWEQNVEDQEEHMDQMMSTMIIGES